MEDATRRSVSALRQAIYYLDRELAPSTKVRAFQRAIDIVLDLDAGELIALVEADSITELEGIGPSTGSVIVDAVLARPGSYLAELDERSRIPTSDRGAAIRDAIRGDCHCHSTWSDGGAPIEAMAATAIALGHDYLVMTDHSARLTVAHGLDEGRLVQQLAEIEALNAGLAPFRILTGMEVDILEDGALDLNEAMLERLDIVVASVHSKLRMGRDEMTRRMVAAISSPHVDILGHCTNRKVVGRGRPPSEFDADLVFAACARFDTAVEINCRPERQDPPDELLALALDWELKVAIDTDAHAPGQMEWLGYGCDKAARHEVDPADIVNTWSADELVAWAGDHPTL